MRLSFLLILNLILSVSAFPQLDTSAYYASSRLDYYTNEEAGEVMVYVPQSMKNHKISIDLVFEYEFLNRGFVVVPGGISTVPFQMERLREGENEITVSFYEDDVWKDSRKIYLKILPHRDNAVKVDRAGGGLFVSGLPYFPFGFFSYFPVQPALPEEEVIKGFNMISPYQDIDKKTLKSRKAYMNRCADLGMRVNYNLCSVAGGGGVAGSGSEGLTRQQKMERLQKEVEMFRDHPALLAWYIADEPDGRGLPADSLRETYKLIKELDPYHPVSMVISSPRKTGEYREVTDIMMTDPYPVPNGNIGDVKEYTGKVWSNSWPEEPVWTVVQAFGGNEWWEREPDAREVRAMTYLAIIHGSTGVQYFIRNSPNSFPKSTATWGECGTLATEIAELTADILSPHPAPVVIASEGSIHARAWNRRGLVTIAVVNVKNEPAEFTLRMEDVTITIPADVMFENRKIVVADGVVKDMIDGYGTRVYRIDARQKTGQEVTFLAGNLVKDPGFEDLTSAGVPAACYAYPGDDPGCTYFIDPRRHYEGDHSLRMNNPSTRPGNELRFYGIVVDTTKTYTVSIMARTGPSSNKAGGRKGGPVQFRLSFGTVEKVFDCTDNWQKYEIGGIRIQSAKDQNIKVSPILELIGKGTAWFDMLQVTAE
jgi:hypothetical protein